MGLLERFCQFLVQRWVVLSAIAVLFIFPSWWISQSLKFDQSIESLYASQNPRLLDFQRSRQIFGGDEFIILAYRDPGLMDKAGNLTDAAEERMYALKQKLEQIPGVEPGSVQCLADALRTPYGKSRIRQFVTGLLLGEDGQSTAVVSRLQPVGAGPVSRAETFRQIRELADQHTPRAVVVGEPIQVHDMFRYVEEDGAILGLWSSLLLMFVTFLLFRSLRWMLLPLAIVQINLVWTKALLVISQMQLSMVSSMLNSLVTIIGIATVMHITLTFRNWRATLDREAALKQTLRELTVPILWTILTTSAGFAALISSQIAPMASFGIMMTLATLLLLLVVAMVVPAGILIGSTTSIPGTAWGEKYVADSLAHFANYTARHPVFVWLTTLILTAVASFGGVYLELETDFSKNFRASSPIVQALDFYETHLGGSGTWEVNFQAPESLTDDYLTKVQNLVDDLRLLEQRTTEDRLTKVVALTDGLSLIPTNLVFTRLSLETRLNLLSAVQPEFVQSVYNPAERRMRILLRSLERQPSESKLQLIQEVEQIARKHFPEGNSGSTGLFVLLAYLIENLMEDQWTSSYLSAAALVIIMWMAERNLFMALGLLLPNLLPLCLVLGTMGWLGMKVNIASAMIASVSLGLTIDSSIHYLASYRRFRDAGAGMNEAISRSHRETGLALVWTNLALVAGFSVLTTSHFIPLVYFGVLVSVAMISGLIGNLVMLPMLIRLVDHLSPYSPRPASTPGHRE